MAAVGKQEQSRKNNVPENKYEEKVSGGSKTAWGSQDWWNPGGNNHVTSEYLNSIGKSPISSSSSRNQPPVKEMFTESWKKNFNDQHSFPDIKIETFSTSPSKKNSPQENIINNKNHKPSSSTTKQFFDSNNEASFSIFTPEKEYAWFSGGTNAFDTNIDPTQKDSISESKDESEPFVYSKKSRNSKQSAKNVSSDFQLHSLEIKDNNNLWHTGSEHYVTSDFLNSIGKAAVISSSSTNNQNPAQDIFTTAWKSNSKGESKLSDIKIQNFSARNSSQQEDRITENRQPTTQKILEEDIWEQKSSQTQVEEAVVVSDIAKESITQKNVIDNADLQRKIAHGMCSEFFFYPSDNHSSKRSKSPTRIKDTCFVQSVDAVETETGKWHKARECITEGGYTLKNTARVVGSYGLDGVCIIHKGLDTATLGLWSAVGEGLDYAAEGVRAGVRRGVRWTTGDQRLGQNAGDYSYLAVSLIGPKKFLAPAEVAQKAAKLSNVAKFSDKVSKSTKTPKLKISSTANLNAANDNKFLKVPNFEKATGTTGHSSLNALNLEIGTSKVSFTTPKGSVPKSPQIIASNGAPIITNKPVQVGKAESNVGTVGGGEAAKIAPVPTISKPKMNPATNFESSQALTERAYLAKECIKDIENITDLKVPEQQRKLLKQALQERNFPKLTKQTAEVHRARFNSERTELRKEWEKQTSRQWPTYTLEDVEKLGISPGRVGRPYDVHEIIPNVHGGPLEWWNVHPARFPDQHQAGIHGKDSALRKIINNYGGTQ